MADSFTITYDGEPSQVIPRTPTLVPRFGVLTNPDKKFHYNNTEIHHTGGKRVVRTVKIRNGKGHKSVKIYSHKRCMGTAKRQLTEEEIHKIHNRKFITGLFNDCKICRAKTKFQ